MSRSAGSASRPAWSRISSTRRWPSTACSFPPELSTSNRATIGGMISTDACGQGSCLYGKTRDHVLELTTILPDGTMWRSAPIDDDELARITRRDDRVGAIHRLVDSIQREQGEADRRALPQAQPLPHRLRPGAYPRRRRPLQPQRDPLRRGGHAGLHRGSETQRAADPPPHGPGQRTLRQLRRGLARCAVADAVRCRLHRDRGFQGAGAGPGGPDLGGRARLLSRG